VQGSGILFIETADNGLDSGFSKRPREVADPKSQQPQGKFRVRPLGFEPRTCGLRVPFCSCRPVRPVL
jgi:hypothetical protein